MEHDDGQRRARQRKTVQYGDERRRRIKSKYRNKQYDVTVIEATQAVVLPDEEPQKKKVSSTNNCMPIGHRSALFARMGRICGVNLQRT